MTEPVMIFGAYTARPPAHGRIRSYTAARDDNSASDRIYARQ
jgi:hypothetical protein